MFTKNILKEEEILPIVDGKYEARISITYANPEEGIDAIKKTIERSRKARISNIPMFLLHDLKPLLQGKDVMLVLPLGERPSDSLQALGKVAVTKAKIYKTIKEQMPMSPPSFSRMSSSISRGRMIQFLKLMRWNTVNALNA